MRLPAGSRTAQSRVNRDAHDGHASCGSVTRASRFLIGLVTCFAAEVPGRHVSAAGEGLAVQRLSGPGRLEPPG